MRWLIYLTLPLFLYAQSPFESVFTAPHKTSMFNTKIDKKIKDKKIMCRIVCDKKIYREQVIREAIAFYTNSKDYSFNTYNSSK